MILLTSDGFAKTLAEIPWDTLSVQTIIWTNAPVDLPVKERRSWDSLLSGRGPPPEPSLPTPSSYLQGFGTSGTTGRTKTVLHSHRNVCVHSFATIQALELSADDDHCWGHLEAVERYAQTLKVLRARDPQKSERELMESLVRIKEGDDAIERIGARFAGVDPDELEREAVNAVDEVRAERASGSA